ncbi:MAG: adenylate/guanylate cyclase domain-containing protein [Acidimicrobiia bacterium]
MPAPDSPDPRRVGAEAVGRLRRSTAGLLAGLVQRDPERMAKAVELGLVRREWLEHPGEEPFATARPVEVLERWLERAVEQRPSTLAALGLSTIQILSSGAEDETGEGVRETLTVAFIDLEGFTAFTASEGDESASRLLAEHQRVVGPIVRSRGGRSVKHLGDGLLLTFVNPEAAVLAGLELVEARREPLRLRVGLHLGEVLVMLHHDVVGHVVNVAARVAESARGGDVLATGAVRDAVGGLPGMSFGRPRRRAFKGIAESVPVYPVRRQ